MKKLLLILALTLPFAMVSLTSCSTKTIVIQEQSLVVNLEKFTNGGFKIIPLDYANKNLEIVGIIYKEFSHRRSVEYMIEESIADAVKLGANGLIKFDITYRFDEKNLTSYVVKGVAVKFKD